MRTLTLECDSFTVTPLKNSRVRIEMIDDVVAPLNARHTRAKAAGRLAHLTGQPVSVKTLDRWVRSKKNPVPWHKLGGRPTFIEAELQDWVNSGGVNGVKVFVL